MASLLRRGKQNMPLPQSRYRANMVALVDVAKLGLRISDFVDCGAWHRRSQD